MKTQIVSRLIALSLCAAGMVTLVSQSPVSATEGSWCNQGANWPGAWTYSGGMTCSFDQNRYSPTRGTCVGVCYEARSVLKSPDQCYFNTNDKCKRCEWDKPAEVRFWDQERSGTCKDNKASFWDDPDCYCTKVTAWADIPHSLGGVSQPIPRCHTVNPCL